MPNLILVQTTVLIDPKSIEYCFKCFYNDTKHGSPKRFSSFVPPPSPHPYATRAFHHQRVLQPHGDEPSPEDSHALSKQGHLYSRRQDLLAEAVIAYSQKCQEKKEKKRKVKSQMRVCFCLTGRKGVSWILFTFEFALQRSRVSRYGGASIAILNLIWQSVWK